MPVENGWMFKSRLKMNVAYCMRSSHWHVAFKILHIKCLNEMLKWDVEMACSLNVEMTSLRCGKWDVEIRDWDVFVN